jgi:hypothetical protein
MADASKDQPALSAVAYDIAFQAALNKKLIEENLPPVSTKVERGQQLAMELPQGQDWPRVMTDTCPQPSRFATLVAFGGKRLQADADSVFTFNMEATMRRIGRAFAQLQEKVGGGAKDREMLDAQKAALYLLPFRLIREELGKHDVTWLSLQFSYGSPAVPCSIEMLFPVSSLQHSMSRGLEGTRKKPNYYTLTDLTVSELASFLMEEPRAKRRGRYLRVME